MSQAEVPLAPGGASPLARAGGWIGRRSARLLIQFAKRQGRRRRWSRAAALYDVARRLAPHRQELSIHTGNCLKEAERHGDALACYGRVDDPRHKPEALFQSSEALFRSGEVNAAIAAVQAAQKLGHEGAPRRLAEYAAGGREGEARRPDGPLAVPTARLVPAALLDRLMAGADAGRTWLGSLDRSTHRPVRDAAMDRPGVTFIQTGWMKAMSRGRHEPLLMGIVSIRAQIVSNGPVRAVELKLGGMTVASETPRLVKRRDDGRCLQIVNIWLDSARLKPGRRALSLVAHLEGGGRLAASRVINIAHAPAGFEIPESDAFVPSAPTGYDGDVVAEASARPADVRPAERRLFAGPIREILVMRVDQLGDVSASLASMQRLADIFGEARLTALVPPGLIGMVEASGLFDSVLGLELVYDHASEQRYLDPAEEKRVRRLLESHDFDLAIDLCPGDETRPLLRMTGARHLIGFNPSVFRYLDFGVEVAARDKVNRKPALSHAATVSMLVEALATAMTPARPPVKRQRDDEVRLAEYGLTHGDYLVIHSGARHPINCWPLENYLALAGRLTDATGQRLMFFADSSVDPALVEAVGAGERILMAGKMPMDHFDAILANARLMIGNDSGPKHLAAARGVETVSVHINRLNWREWGQDGRGLILSKKVPCCGCRLNDEALCGRDVACVTSITVDEVFDAVMSRLRPEVTTA